MKTKPALLEIILPSRIVVPANADLNALFAFMATARCIDTISAGKDVPVPAIIKDESFLQYTGRDVRYFDGDAAVKVERLKEQICDTREEAQAAKNEIMRIDLAERAERAERIAAINAPVIPAA